MGKILDYEEMLYHLDQLDSNVIRKMPPIGYTTHGYPIPHYTYGTGSAHVILTAGTHATELIGNCFLILACAGNKCLSFPQHTGESNPPCLRNICMYINIIWFILS